MPIAVIVEWYGPYDSLEDLKNAVKDEWEGKWRTLYMALADWNKYQYVGLTEYPLNRFNSHIYLNREDNKTFYIGHIVTQGITGPRNGGQPPDLKLAERALIRFLQPVLNTDKKDKDPEDFISIFSYFYDPENDDFASNPLPKFPKVLAYNPDLPQWWFTEKGVKQKRE